MRASVTKASTAGAEPSAVGRGEGAEGCGAGAAVLLLLLSLLPGRFLYDCIVVVSAVARLCSVRWKELLWGWV